MMILFIKSTAVLHKYLNDKLKILHLLQFFPEVAQNSQNSGGFMFREIPEYSRFSRSVATLITFAARTKQKLPNNHTNYYYWQVPAGNPNFVSHNIQSRVANVLGEIRSRTFQGLDAQVSIDPFPEHPHGTGQNSPYPLWHNPPDLLRVSLISGYIDLHQHTSLTSSTHSTCPNHRNLPRLINKLSGSCPNYFQSSIYLYSHWTATTAEYQKKIWFHYNITQICHS